MFQSITPLPPDPILGLLLRFRADANPDKVDMGVGVYRDAAGDTPVMRAVKRAEEAIWKSQSSKAYIAPAGAEDFTAAAARLLLGERLAESLGGRCVTAQAPGGSGGLRLAAEFVAGADADAAVWVSDPSWANHAPLLGAAGLRVESYPYYDRASHALRFDEMMDRLGRVPAGDMVLLHGCCHNPSGADLDGEQWRAVGEAARRRGFVPFIDLAYQGLGDGLERDVGGVRLLAEMLPEMVVVSSFSKNFGLYRDRVGALTVLCERDDAAAAVATRVAAAARVLYSMPPDHGAAVVQLILDDPALRREWEAELEGMRGRIQGLRGRLAEALAGAGIARDFGFIRDEKGMFSFLGIDRERVRTLVDDYSIYMVGSSRINVASLNDGNIDYVVDALAAVLAD